MPVWLLKRVAPRLLVITTAVSILFYPCFLCKLVLKANFSLARFFSSSSKIALLKYLNNNCFLHVESLVTLAVADSLDYLCPLFLTLCYMDVAATPVKLLHPSCRVWRFYVLAGSIPKGIVSAFSKNIKKFQSKLFHIFYKKLRYKKTSEILKPLRLHWFEWFDGN